MENNNNSTMYEWLDNMTGGFSPNWLNLENEEIRLLEEARNRNDNPVEYEGVVINKNTGEKNAVIKFNNIDKIIVNDAVIGNIDTYNRAYFVVDKDQMDDVIDALDEYQISVDGPYKSIDEAYISENIHQTIERAKDDNIELNWTEKAQVFTDTLTAISECESDYFTQDYIYNRTSENINKFINK